MKLIIKNMFRNVSIFMIIQKKNIYWYRIYHVLFQYTQIIFEYRYIYDTMTNERVCKTGDDLILTDDLSFDQALTSQRRKKWLFTFIA